MESVGSGYFGGGTADGSAYTPKGDDEDEQAGVIDVWVVVVAAAAVVFLAVFVLGKIEVVMVVVLIVQSCLGGGLSNEIDEQVG